MKKLILVSFLAISAMSFSFDNALPDDVDLAIRRAVSSSSGSERRENYNWYKDSYIDMMERLNKSGIPEQDRQVIIRRLSAMYGANYPKQLSRVNDEIADYQNLVNRIREEQVASKQKVEAENNKSKNEIQQLLVSADIPKNELDKIQADAKEEYPDNFTLQKAFIKGAIKTYKNLKK